MDEGTKCRVPIGDACVSMRVCFDSLCFSSTQQRLADEEDASQLPTHGAVAVVAAAGQRAISNVTGASTITAMGTFESCRSCCVSRTRKSSSSKRFSVVAMPRYKNYEVISTSFSVCFPLNHP